MSNSYVAPVYAKSDNKNVVRIDSITGQMPADQLVIGGANNGTRKYLLRTNAATVAGTLVPKNGILSLYLAGATAVTMPVAIAGVDDGKECLIVSETAQAHTVTYATTGFSGGGAGADVATFSAKGDYLRLIALNGVWYNVAKSAGVTLA
jgi:hypothetical protein